MTKQYLTPEDIGDTALGYIRGVELEMIDGDARVVIYFREFEKGLIVDRESARVLTEALGPHPLIERFFPRLLQ